MGERRQERSGDLLERRPDLQGWSALDAFLDIDVGENRRLSGKWRGSEPAVVMLVVAADAALVLNSYSHLTIPLLTICGIAAILKLSRDRHERQENPPQPRGQPAGEEEN